MRTLLPGARKAIVFTVCHFLQKTVKAHKGALFLTYLWLSLQAQRAELLAMQQQLQQHHALAGNNVSATAAPASADLTQLQQDLLTHQQKVRELEEVRDKLEEILTEMEKEAAETEEKLASATNRCEGLASRLQQVEEQLNSKQMELEAAVQEMHELQLQQQHLGSYDGSSSRRQKAAATGNPFASDCDCGDEDGEASAAVSTTDVPQHILQTDCQACLKTSKWMANCMSAM
jgi:vacuolar-type H+-ATPase subunit I/STV1